MIALIAEPLAPGAPQLSTRTTSTLRLTGSAPTSGTTVFNGYTVNAEPTSTQSPSLSSQNDGYEVSLASLSSGVEYTVSVRTVSGGEESAPTSAAFFTSKDQTAP